MDSVTIDLSNVLYKNPPSYPAPPTPSPPPPKATPKTIWRLSGEAAEPSTTPAPENYRNVEPLNTIFVPTDGSRNFFAHPTPAPAPAPAPPTVEGFDANAVNVDIDFDYWEETGLKYFMVPFNFMSRFDPTVITNNERMDKAINYLAGSSLIDGVFKDIRDISMAAISNKMKKKLSQLEKLDISGEIQKKISQAEAKTKMIKNKITNFSVKELIDENLKENLKAKCKGTQPPEHGYKTENADLEHDRAIIKKYMFKTILLLVSFYSVYQWSYLLLAIYSTPDSCAFIKRMLGLDTASLNEMSYNFPGGSVIKSLVGAFMSVYRLLDPFEMTTKFLNLLNYVLFTIIAQRDMNRYLDKKIWFILIFIAIFFAMQYLIEKYSQYMNDIQNFNSKNTIIIYLYILFVFFYLESFLHIGITRVIKMTIMGLFFLITNVIPVNIYILICLYFNPYVALFVTMVLFILISLFGLFIFPNFGIFETLTRLKALSELINLDAEKKLETTTNRFMLFFKKVAHLIYNNFFFVASLLWIFFLFYKFDKQLIYKNLRMNIFFILIIMIVFLITLKFLPPLDGGLFTGLFRTTSG
jgi:hypothetical protein